MICKKCGKRNKRNARFCENCGEALENSNSISESLLNEEGEDKHKFKRKKLIFGVGLFLIVAICICALIANIKDSDIIDPNTNIANGSRVVQDGEWIYYGIENGLDSDIPGYYLDGQDLAKSRLDGSDAQYLTHDNDTAIRSIFITNEWVYFVKDTYGIYRVKKDGSKEEYYADGNSIFGIVKDKMYYLSMKKDCANEQILEQLESTATISNTICSRQIGGNYEEEIIYQSENYTIESGQIYEGEIYYVESIENSSNDTYTAAIKKVDSDGNTITIVQGETNEMFTNICVTEKGIFYLAYSEEGCSHYKQISEEVNDMTLGESEIALFYSKSPSYNDRKFESLTWGQNYIVLKNSVYVDDMESDGFIALDFDSGKKIKSIGIDTIEENPNTFYFIDGWIYYYSYIEDDDNLIPTLSRIKIDDEDASPQLVAQGILSDDDSDYSDEEYADDSYNEIEFDDETSDESIQEYELWGDWQVLTDGDEPESFRFLEDGTVYVGDAVGWDEASINEYSYSIEGNELVINTDESSSRFEFELEYSSYGGKDSVFLTIYFSEDDRLTYKKKIE